MLAEDPKAPGTPLPALVLVIPVLHTVAYQPGKATLSELVLVSTGLLAAFGLLYVVLAWALGPTWVASMGVFGAVVWFYGYPIAIRAAGAAGGPLAVALVGGLVTGALVFLASAKPHGLRHGKPHPRRDRRADGCVDEPPDRR